MDTEHLTTANENDKQIIPLKDDDNNILSGDNKVDVGIKPDVKDNNTKVQICSCSFKLVFNCFSKKNSDDH